MIDLHYPESTIVGKPVPKNAFYKHLDVNAKMKQHFVDDVVRIDWLYKLAPSTINVEDGKQVHEIVVFSAQLKSQECPDDVFLFIDKNIPRHIVFVLEFDGRYKLLLNYKEWLDPKAGTFRIVQSFASEWLSEEEISLPLSGQSMDVLYESMAGSISGYGTTNGEDTKHIIELEAQIAKARRDVEMLQKRIRNERQLNRQMELNGEARKLKSQIALWQKELDVIKEH